MFKLKRVYEKAEKEDGFRILVDRLWPRGVSKEKAKLNLWLKEISPSEELRKWFNHEEKKWSEFQKRYKKELSEKKDLVKIIKDEEKKNKTVTLLYAAKDEEHNDAVVLKEFL